MYYQVHSGSGQPIYKQIVEQTLSALASGVLHSGEPLPGIRTLALELKVNPATIVKAYAELEAAKILEARQGEGCFVASGAARRVQNLKNTELRERLALLTETARILRLTPENLLNLVQEAMMENQSGEKSTLHLKGKKREPGTD